MINRLIEPTSGTITIDGVDVRQQSENELRRRIGYVIQGGSLFPHMTVERNIAVVPKLLGWDADRIRERVTELLDLVGLDPERYRGRYPRELSGGQQQRVGVARGLAADPPVILMDEPFGAVDPITRQRLQDELLSIQRELGKTIVCVTHDIDEAIKLGDRILLLREGAHIAQYDTPEAVLATPADDFVADFVGAGSALKALSLARVGDVELVHPVTARIGEDVAEVRRRAEAAGERSVVVLDERGRPVGWPFLRQLRGSSIVRPEGDLVDVDMRATLNDALDTMLSSSHGGVIVTGDRNQFPRRRRLRLRHRSRARPGGRAMSVATTDAGPSAPAAGSPAPVTGPAAERSWWARLPREDRGMLIAPPVLAALILGGYALWRGTADLDTTEQRQLRWSTVRAQFLEHLQLTWSPRCSWCSSRCRSACCSHRGRLRRLAPGVVAVANIGQAAPSLGLLVLLYIWLNDAGWTGFGVAVLTLTLYGLLPVLRNTITGLRGVDPTLVEAGRGIGMSAFSVLVRIELPLAIPVIMTGLRTALVLVVGTAALATFIDGGGLGGIINSGISLFRFEVMVAGALLVAALALAVEWVGRVLEVLVRPRGL